jgi:predicted DNA-binding WGR domain protein
MGVYTIYDILISNPGYIYYDKTKLNDKLFSWHNSVRVVLKDGTITDKGIYNMEGDVVINKKKFLFNSTTRYSVSDISTNWLKCDGYLILDITYKYLVKHPQFKKCIKNNNLYDLLTNISTNINSPPFLYVGTQQIYINGENSILDKDKWAFTNPGLKTPHGVKNKKRINNIINKFIKSACKKNIKINNKIISLKLEFISNKSNKFWNIEYKHNTGEFRVKYGKIGTNGIILIKTDTVKNIEKLIESKIKKKYKLISTKNINLFTIKK